MTPNRLMLLLTLYTSKGGTETFPSGSGPDMAYLVSKGLLQTRNDPPIPSFMGFPTIEVLLTDEGKSLIDTLLGKVNASGAGGSTTWNEPRNTSTLDDQKFFMVASGDCMKSGPHGRPTLKKPPVTVQITNRDATAEANRLAALSRGEKFFVLQAMSVHEVQPTPATSKLLWAYTNK